MPFVLDLTSDVRYKQGFKEGFKEGLEIAKVIIVKHLLSKDYFSEKEIAHLANASLAFVKKLKKGLAGETQRIYNKNEISKN